MVDPVVVHGGPPIPRALTVDGDLSFGAETRFVDRFRPLRARRAGRHVLFEGFDLVSISAEVTLAPSLALEDQIA